MMEEKIELFNNAINEKTNEIDKKIEELKSNKETAVEKLLKDKEDLENELGKVGLESYIAEEYKGDLEKINSEIENQENTLEEKTQELIEEKGKAERAKESYRIWSNEKDKQEESIKNNNETIEKLNIDKASIEEELKNDRLESYIKDEYNQNLAKVNDEISSLTQQNEQKASHISELENRMTTLESDYDIESYVQKQEEAKREAEEQRKAEEAKKLEEEQRKAEETEKIEEERRKTEEAKKIEEQRKVEENQKTVESEKTDGENSIENEAETESADNKTKKQYTPPVINVHNLNQTKPSQQTIVNPNKKNDNQVETEKTENDGKPVKIDEDIYITIGQNGISIEYGNDKGTTVWDIPINKIGKELIDQEYFDELMYDYGVERRYRELADNNLVVAIRELNRVMPREKTDAIMKQYFEVLKPDKRTPEDLKKFKDMLNITYDRTNLDYLKPRNILSRYINKDKFDYIKESADIAEEFDFANIKHDKPGVIRKIISKLPNIKDKIKLLGSGKEQREDDEDFEVEDIEENENKHSFREKINKFKNLLYNKEAAEESNKQHTEEREDNDNEVNQEQEHSEEEK